MQMLFVGMDGIVLQRVQGHVLGTKELVNGHMMVGLKDRTITGMRIIGMAYPGCQLLKKKIISLDIAKA